MHSMGPDVEDEEEVIAQYTIFRKYIKYNGAW
jgi:hypothetical protein